MATEHVQAQRTGSSGTASAAPSLPSRPVTVALLGNPNTGKSTLFNALTGLRQRVGNYSGVTVETKKGHYSAHGQGFEVIDLPGTYSLAPRSPDEMVAVDIILGHQAEEPRPDVVISLVDASNLERNLYLTTQALELGVPVVLALNMTDVAEAQGLRIDARRLSEQLGIPVVPMQANRGIGLDALQQAVAAAARSAPSVAAKRVPFPEALEHEVGTLHKTLGGGVPEFLVRRALLDVGGYVERLLRPQAPLFDAMVVAARQRLAAAGCPVPAVEARARYAWIRQAAGSCIERPRVRPVTWTDRLDRVLMHRVFGTITFLFLMFLVFQAIFSWATPLMDLIKAGKSGLADALRGVLPPGPLTSLLLEGVLEGVGGVLVFLPQILILFGFLAVLEDCGYMARAAFLMDRLMARAGLSGKSFIPLLSSVACAIPGIMATRVIENRRDRLATILVAPLMSCSARLPVYILLIGAFIPAVNLVPLIDFTLRLGSYEISIRPFNLQGLVLFGLYMIGIILAPLIALLLKRTLLRGETPSFIMEMPLYKRPSLRGVLRRMTDSGWAFVRRAGTIILACMVLVWALLYFPRGEDGTGRTYEAAVASEEAAIRTLEAQADAASEEEQALIAKQLEAKRDEVNALRGAWKRQSALGRIGQALEPVFAPLGWDWKIGTAALASFPAREVIVGTLGILYNLGEGEPDDLKDPLSKALQEGTGDGGGPALTIASALSLMVFFALCCQCASTLAVIRRETKSWTWPAFTFFYMTSLAYLGALLVYQIGSRWG